MKKERIEDLGILREKLSEILEIPIFFYCNNKHQFEEWEKTMKDVDSPDDTLYEIHMKVRHVKSLIEDCYWIAHGDHE